MSDEKKEKSRVLHFNGSLDRRAPNGDFVVRVRDDGFELRRTHPDADHASDPTRIGVYNYEIKVSTESYPERPVGTRFVGEYLWAVEPVQENVVDAEVVDLGSGRFEKLRHQLSEAQLRAALQIGGKAVTRWAAMDPKEASRLKQSKTAQAEATRALDWWAIWLPARISKEILGDYIEDINRRAAEGQGPWRIYGRMIAAMIYTTINTFSYVRKQIGRKEKA